jgi:predicted GNAT family N-acyltransferase
VGYVQMPNTVTVDLVTTDAQRRQAFAIRTTVFEQEQGIDPALEFDEYDDAALHVIGWLNAEVVGTGRLVCLMENARLGRMAVLPHARRHGVGRAIVDALLRIARERRYELVVLHAQRHAIGFYERCGFVGIGDEFEEAGIPHRRMERRLG